MLQGTMLFHTKSFLETLRGASDAEETGLMLPRWAEAEVSTERVRPGPFSSASAPPLPPLGEI